MYLLRAANKAVIRARQLPQHNSFSPCAAWGAEPSPGTVLLLKAAQALLPWLTTAMLSAAHID